MRPALRQVVLFAASKELVFNGSLVASAAGWTPVNSPTITHGAAGASIQNAGTTYGIIYQPLALEVGRTYRVKADIDYTGPGFARVEIQVGVVSLVGATGISVAADGSYFYDYVATAAAASIVAGNRNDNNAVSAFRNISVRRIK